MPLGDTHLCRSSWRFAMEGGMHFPKPLRAALLSGSAAICVLSGALLLAASGVSAQSYPSKMIKVICPIPPGSVLDVTVRLVTPELSARLGTPIVVDNRPGGGGTIGAKEFAKATPDGHTLLAS